MIHSTLLAAFSDVEFALRFRILYTFDVVPRLDSGLEIPASRGY